MRFAQPFSIIVNDFVGLFFPSYCLGCNLSLTKSEDFICTHCKANLARTKLHLEQPNFIHPKLFQITNLSYAMSFCWFHKNGLIQKLLFNLKYEANPSLGVFLGELYAYDLKELYSDAWDLITYVPLHKTKLRKRGYNQAERIAKGISNILEVPLVRVVAKRRNTKSQTKKTRLARFSNVEDEYFAVNQSFEGKNILLVDDVMTTGATLQAAAKPLLQNAKSISIVTMAMVK